MSEPLSEPTPEKAPPLALREWLEFLGGVVLYVAVLAAFIGLPLLAGALAVSGLGKWPGLAVGVLAYLAAFPLWAKVVRPTPGLIQGFYCVSGVLSIFGAMCGFVVLVLGREVPR